MSCDEARRIELAEQEIRDEFAKKIDTKVLNSFALLAGLLASAPDDDTVDIDTLHNVGNIIGLMVSGSRREIEIQRVGGSGVQALQSILEGTQHQGTTNQG